MRQDDMIRDVLDAAMRDEPPCTAGLDAVLARARRIQARRRVGAGVAGVSVTGLALTVALTAAKGGGAGGSGHDLAAPPPASTAPASPSAGGGAAGPGAGAAAMTAPGPMLETLTRLIPSGFTVSRPFAQQGYATVVVTDAAGTGQVGVNVQPDPGGPVDQRLRAAIEAARKIKASVSCTTPAGRPEYTCDREQLPNGTLIMTAQGPAEPNGADRVRMAMVEVVTPDGVRVVAFAYNRVDGATGSPTRATPPLTTDQLRAIVTNPAWLG